MHLFSKPIEEIIRQRYSCRTYVKQPIHTDLQRRITDYIATLGAGPFGGSARFELIAARDKDLKMLRQLGTYGFIKGATGFLVGVMTNGEEDLEDFGWLMERLVLYVTDLGLGSCWLGGTFTKRSFMQKVSAQSTEFIPAILSVGYIAPKPRKVDRLIRRGGNFDRRLNHDRLFFIERFGAALTLSEAAEYALPLEMVRLAPSASNRQPWRVIRMNDRYHFYLRRTPGYRESSLNRLFAKSDLQRIDMGIAMCHFELTAREIGLMGEWVKDDPGIEIPDELSTYSATWLSQ
ncbi:MAG: nitroreductase [Anaerolineales bacterium]|nr:nitroreductase [Anaerolineales bacterium]